MNYNQQFNPQQFPPPGWNQQPQPPKKKSKVWILIVVIVAVAAGGLFYGVSLIGKKFATTIGKIANVKIQREDSLDDALRLSEYQNAINDVASGTGLNDSMKAVLISRIEKLRSAADQSFLLMKEQSEGYNDTLAGENLFSQIDKKWAYNYFIKTGRAEKLKFSLLQLRDSAFLDLPDPQRDSTMLERLPVYTIGVNQGNRNQSVKWENIYFHQPAATVRMNFKTLRAKLRDFEYAVLSGYSNYSSGY